MKRLIPLLATTTLLAATAIGGIWLGFSESGLGALARLAESASSGRLSLQQPTGRLVGPLAIGSVTWNEPGTSVAIERLQLDWSSAALLKLRLSIAEISADRVAIDIAATDEASAPPAGLRLPLAVNVEKIAISRLDYGKLFSLDDLRAAFASDGMNHRLSGVRGKFGKTAVAGEMTLGGDAPLPVQASATLSGQIDEQPVRVVAEAAGPLERIVLKVSAAEGLRGDGQATLTPFARHAFAEAQLALADVDPAAWIAGAPVARLTLRAQIRPDDRQDVALTGDFSVGNAMAGPLDRQRLPLESLSGRFDWTDDGIRIAGLQAALPGQGRLQGGGNWRNDNLALDLEASAARCRASGQRVAVNPSERADFGPHRRRAPAVVDQAHRRPLHARCRGRPRERPGQRVASRTGVRRGAPDAARRTGYGPEHGVFRHRRADALRPQALRAGAGRPAQRYACPPAAP